jgi:hypothetical protein
MVVDSIEYEIVETESREVWKCSECGRFRHRPVIKGARPAICCNVPARLIDRYEQPELVNVSDEI